MLATYVITSLSISRSIITQEEEITEKKSSIDHDINKRRWDTPRHIPAQQSNVDSYADRSSSTESHSSPASASRVPHEGSPQQAHRLRPRRRS